MIEVRKTEIFTRWFESLKDRRAKARIQVRIDRMEMDNFGDVAPVGEGVSELRIFYGPGYRVYFVQIGPTVIILLSGGVKNTQQSDIAEAKEIAQQLESWIMATKTTRWDSAEHLKTEEDIQLYLEACFEEAGDDPAFIVHAFGVIARAKNMSQLARDTGLTREGLYKALSPDGNPTFATVAKVAKALGYKLSVQPAA
jgi:putative addiction module killer protein/probable addiction module antidote protein